jgi:MoaA/NifB/PqqE/SkfB family radical SAM enzyme
MKSANELLKASEGRILFRDLIFVLTYRCNFRCRDCLIGGNIGQQKTFGFEDAIQAINAAAELRTIRAVAFAGGEPFLVYDLMLNLSKHIWENYHAGLSVSTNCSWAVTVEKAFEFLRPLHNYGLHWMLASWDVFHAEFGKIEYVINAVKAAQKLGIHVSIQNIRTADSFRNLEVMELIADEVNINDIEWVENLVVPVGLGEHLSDNTSHISASDVHCGGCDAGNVLNIDVDGEVKPCCGAAFVNPYLSIGNINKSNLMRLVERASIDPVINSLVVNEGPHGLVASLERSSRTDLIPQNVKSSCELCYKILMNSQARQIVKNELQKYQLELIATRVLRQEKNIKVTSG